MFFVLSKVLVFFCMPSNLLGMLGVLGVVLLAVGRVRFGAGCAVAALLGIAIAGWSPVSTLAMRSLEDRFPAYVDDGRPVAGVIVLGGSFDTLTAGARSTVAINDNAERLTEAVKLALRHPDARIIFTGGHPALLSEGPSEASLANRFFTEMGLPPARIQFEDQARTTAENASRLRDMLQPKPGERWLLLTSGYHMPRSVGSFRAAGFDVVAYPVDYRTRGAGLDPFVVATIGAGLSALDVAAREYAGLLAYWLSGRSQSVLAAP